MKTIVIYHKDCTDGTTAAAVVLRKYPDAKVFPLSHGFEPHELEPVLKEAEEGARILTVDCVIGVRDFLDKGFSVTSIDHHIGIKDEMIELAVKDKRFTFIFNNDKSGASLTWSTLFPEKEIPEIIRLVEDGDLWKGTYGKDTKNVGNYLFMLANKPEEMGKLFDAPLDDIRNKGAVISEYSDYLTAHAVKTTEPLTVAIGEHHVPFYNITFNKSEACNQLAKLRHQTVGLFSIDGEKVKISFRSLDGQNPSALDLAKVLGGGGHVKASGAGMKLEDFIKSIVRK
jgi:uncharacterized protein